MSKYRETRNIIKSCIEFIKVILDENNFDDVSVVKTFKQAYTIPFDPQKSTAVICVRIATTTHNGIEVGSDSTLRRPLILLDLFCANGGQMEDLTDLLISKLKKGFDYSEYALTGGVTTDATFDGSAKNGRIAVNTITESEINLNDDKADLNIHDRFRNLITLNCLKSSIEE